MLVLYFVIRFVMRFIVPLARLTQMTHRTMNEVKRKMNQQAKGPEARSTPKPVDGEYIDYEEIK
jgi:hypothetical protein